MSNVISIVSSEMRVRRDIVIFNFTMMQCPDPSRGGQEAGVQVRLSSSINKRTHDPSRTINGLCLANNYRERLILTNFSRLHTGDLIHNWHLICIAIPAKPHPYDHSHNRI